MVSQALKGFVEADWQNGVTEDGLARWANLNHDLPIFFHTAMPCDHKCRSHSASHHNVHVFVFLCPHQTDWLWLVCTQLNSPMRRWGTLGLFVRSFFIFATGLCQYILDIFFSFSRPHRNIKLFFGLFSEAMKYFGCKNNKRKHVRYLKTQFIH